MHSSSMRTARSSSRGGGSPHTPKQAPPLEQTPPPQLPPWLWAWTRSPSTSPLGVGLETPQPDPPKLPPWVWAWKPARHAGIPLPLETCCKACWDTTCNAYWDSTPLNRMTDRCKNITLPQTSFAGGNKNAFQYDVNRPLVDHIPACTGRGRCTCLGGVPAQGRCTCLGVCEHICTIHQ